jgi:hypothetical protein
MSDQTDITWELLQQLGLSITPHSDASLGWGYAWQGRDWVGPFTTPAVALHAAFTEALLALQFRSAAPFTQQAGELWRFDGQEEGWTHIGGPGVEDDEEAAVLASVHVFSEALDTLRGIETSEILIPGPHERWEQALQTAYRASSDVETRLESWQDELEIHHEREGQAENALADEEGED